MAGPAALIYVVVTAAGRAIVQYATRKAAQKTATRIGGKVVEKTANKTVSKLPKAGTSKANQAVESNTLRATRTPPKGKPKGPDIKPTQADRIGGGGAKPKPKANTKPDARGSATQKGLLLTAATTGVGAVGTGEESKRKRGADPMRLASPKKSSTPARTPMSSSGIKPNKKVGGPQSANKGKRDKMPSAFEKSWKDYKTVASAQKAGLDHFMGRDGKKKIAITAEQLTKKKMSLNEYANSLRKKGKK